MVIFGWILRLIPVVIIGTLLHFYLPWKDVVRIVDTDVKRMDVRSNDFIDERDGKAPGQVTRDVRFINATWPDGKPRVYRNEETGWGFPWYFKFDSGNIQTIAQDLRSTKENPVWVQVTHYGWRIELFSMFPNAVDLKQVTGPDDKALPWFSIVFLALLFCLFLFLFVLWRRFLERLEFDTRFENANNGLQQVGRWAKASYRERTEGHARLAEHLAPQGQKEVDDPRRTGSRGVRRN